MRRRCEIRVNGGAYQFQDASSLANLSGFKLVAGFVDKCSMAVMRHENCGHYDKYDKVTKKQMRKALFVSQNMRGTKSISRLEVLFCFMSTRNAFVICL